MTLVLDTNVFISGLRGKPGAPADLFTLAKEQRMTLATSPLLLTEIERVLTYPKVQTLLGAMQGEVASRLADFRSLAYVVPGTTVVDIIKTDPSDNALLSCAIEAQADLIVSGDQAHALPLHSFEGIPIVTPREAVEIIRSVELKRST